MHFKKLFLLLLLGVGSLLQGALPEGEHFDLEVEYAPKRSRPGYVFKLTFRPHSDVVFEPIPHNFIFLIDRSNSIPRPRYAHNKRAVAEALAFLNEGDTFNIMIFDGKVARFASEPVQWNEQNVAEAWRFLERQQHGGYFAVTELYASLGKLLPHNLCDKRINTAILLSDGDTYLSQESQRKMIGEWTKRNDGKVALYSVASGTGNNLPLLEMLSTFNQGQLVYTPDYRELNNRMIDLVRTVRAPIGQEIVATAVTARKRTTVLLQPKAMRHPDLYQNTPFVLYGSTNRLDGFMLFLQGKHNDDVFDVKKSVSFKKATTGNPSIERNWTLLLAHDFYAHYLEDGNREHLQAAKQLLAPLNIPTPWSE